MTQSLAQDREQLRTQRFDLKAIYETSRLLNSSLDLTFILDNLLLISMSKLLVTRGTVLLYDDLLSSFQVAASKGISTLTKGEPVHVEELPVGSCFTGEAVPPSLRFHQIHLVLPLTAHRRRIGLLCFGRPATGGVFSNQQLEFIQSLVNFSANSVQNARMVDELKLANRDLDNKIQKLNTLFDISTEFSSANLDREKLLKLLSFAVMGQLLVHRYMFLLRRSDLGDKEYEMVTAKGVSQEPLSDTLCERVCSMKSLVLLDTVRDEKPWDELYDRGLRFVLPIHLQDKVAGVLCLGPKMTGQAYSQADVEFSSALGSLALTSLQNSYLVEELIEKERLEEEMRLASGIQQRLLPRDDMVITGADIAFSSVPTRHVGGDYFDVQSLDANRLLVAIADVTGKGIPAALLMSNIQACLQLLAGNPQGLSMPEATARINRVICKNTDPDKFITFFWGIFDGRDRSFTYVNAGHDNPVLLRNDGSIERLETGGLLLGVIQAAQYEEGRVVLASGESIVMYTDGITEAMNNEMQLYEEERMIELLQSSKAHNATEMLSILRTTVDEFTEGAPQSDDMTVVVLKSP